MTHNLNWNEAIFFFDVDDTLINTFTNSIKASAAFSEVLSKEIDPNIANLIQERFKEIFQILAYGHWGKSVANNEHAEIIARITTLQSPVISQYGSIRKWSREVLLKIAAEKYHINLSSALIQAAVNKYWEKVAKLSVPKEGVLELFNTIKNHHRPIYLVTGSDARLKLNDEGLFIYDPKESEQFKINRMELLKSEGFIFDGVSIGDPEDKPHRDFFQKAISVAEKDLGYPIENKNLIMFGDSYEADLETPERKLGFGLVVLYRQDQAQTIEENDRYISTSSLLSVTNYLV